MNQMQSPSDQPRRPVLVLFAHPALQKSRVNSKLIDGLDQIPGVTFHDLYEAYPDLCIDVRAEQELLETHDVVIFQHPFYWYSTPSILKEWQDLVLEHGWAYGSTGNALRGKTLLSVVSTGGKESAYHPDGYNRHTVRQLLAPIEQTAHLCGMTFLAPFVAHATLRIPTDVLAVHTSDYHRLVIALRDDQVDLEKAAARDRSFINQDLNDVIRGEIR